eukprot:1420595-Pyramimonas_sp.AAC.1
MNYARRKSVENWLNAKHIGIGSRLKVFSRRWRGMARAGHVPGGWAEFCGAHQLGSTWRGLSGERGGGRSIAKGSKRGQAEHWAQLERGRECAT